jgi:phosphoribosylaminoimidazolecarboxamide formyltransferase / IMP cyclohydrolase
MKARRALVSVHEKAGVADFVRGLQELGLEVVAADGTEQYLRDEGIPVKSVEQHIGAKALAGGGKVKTLHPRLSQALLWGRAETSELDEIEGADDLGFDMLVMNVRPFERVAARRDSRESDIIDAIDVDGPSIMRAAAKNFERVLVVADPEAYPLVLEELRETDLDPSYETRRLLASRAFDATAHYELSVASWFSEVDDFPTYMMRDYVKMIDLPYGENPHQRAAYYVEVGARRHLLSMVEQLQGRDLGFNNLNDLHAARCTVSEFTIPACVIIKHGAPIGCAVSGDIAGAFERALSVDERSAYGGVVAVNRQVDIKTARAFKDRTFEVLFAPDYTDEARSFLSEHMPDMRVLLDRERRKKSPGERDMRRVIGGLLVQDTDLEHDDREFMDVVTEKSPTESQWGDMLFGWRVAKWVRSNAIVLGKDLTTVGIGGCNPSRHDGIEFALGKAGEQAKDAMLASDAFLGYDDTVQRAIAAGIGGIIQPGGSRRDDEIISLCDEAGIPMVFTHRRHFRH